MPSLDEIDFWMLALQCTLAGLACGALFFVIVAFGLHYWVKITGGE